MQLWQILLIITGVLAVVLIVLFILGKRLEKKQAAQKEQMEAAKQNVTLLIIDKKRLRVKDSGLPQIVIDQVPKIMRRSKLPIVKVKIGPKIMNMISEESIFDIIPVKKEVRATISGIYITEVRGLHSPLPVPEKKKKFSQRMRDKLFAKREQLKADKAQADKEAAKKKNKKK
ncbi:MAG: hypothetical protein ACSW8H_07445 [bacterium]